MPSQWPDEDLKDGRGAFAGCLFSVGLALAIMAVAAFYRWLG